MFKMITLLKRRPGLSPEDFVAYYESVHSKLGERYLRPYAVRYARNYLRPIPNPLTGELVEAEHDVMTEVWFPDRSVWEKAMSVFAAPGVAEAMADDEERLFDRSRSRLFIIDGERVSDIAT